MDVVKISEDRITIKKEMKLQNMPSGGKFVGLAAVFWESNLLDWQVGDMIVEEFDPVAKTITLRKREPERANGEATAEDC